jgi:hypothetical protein
MSGHGAACHHCRTRDVRAELPPARTTGAPLIGERPYARPAGRYVVWSYDARMSRTIGITVEP